LWFYRLVWQYPIPLCTKERSTLKKIADSIDITHPKKNMSAIENNIIECAKSSYIGIFFEVDKDK
jgi:hypothetical protein